MARGPLFALLACVVLLSALTTAWAAPQITVRATVETDPVKHKGDAADDPCIWVHPGVPEKSLIIGTDKQGGLAVYDLAGRELQYIDGFKPNNVDLRYGFPLGGERIDLVTASDRATNTIAAFRVNAEERRLVPLSIGKLEAGIKVYGTCMYRSPKDGRFYTVLDSGDGEVEQWELLDDGHGDLTAELRRSLNVGSKTEGCVADDELGVLYIAEEGTGIWKYGAEPGDGDSRQKVDAVGPGGHLTADVEGLAIYYASDEAGYLIASSQGDSTYCVYERSGNNAFAGSFRVVAAEGIDGVTGTDGIDVTNVPLGPAFPSGLFVTQDDKNDGHNQNFKLVPWQAIAEGASPPLTIDLTHTPKR